MPKRTTVPPSTKAAWSITEWLADTGVKSRMSVYALEDRGLIETVKVGRRRLIKTSPTEFIARAEAANRPPKPRGRPGGIRAPAPDERPNRLGRPPGSKDRQPRKRHGSAASSPADAPLPIAAASQ